ncbi:MAG: sigma-70 family RNA polymerase sigma factor [Ruminococcaceae bacterium]|nr:sigma-70 family RNA polymerase sigma factor [Oscillospiraceae bacterium]
MTESQEYKCCERSESVQSDPGFRGTDGSSVTEDAYESDAEILHLLRIIREETKDPQRSDAFSALLVRYRPLIETMVSKYAQSVYGMPVSPIDRQELEEEASIALYHAARFYRAGTHATFGYFARVCIRNRLVSFLRKQKHEEYCIPIDDTAALHATGTHAVPADALTIADVGEQIVQRDAFRALFDRFLATLTEYERRVFHLYVKGCSYKEIAGTLDVSPKSVDNAVYRIRVKLKQQLQAQ